MPIDKIMSSTGAKIKYFLTRKYVVPTEHMLAIDSKAQAGQQMYTAFQNNSRGGDVELRGAVVVGVGYGEDGDYHGDGAVEVEHRED